MNKPTKAIAALCLLNSANLYALGVGEIETHSALNQVLRAKIPLLSSKNEDPSNVRIGIASREVFKKSGIDRPHYLTEIKFTPVLNKNGEISIEVLSNSTIKEPFVNFILEIEWPQGRTLKEFTILLDPPVTMSDLQPAPVKLAHGSKKKTSNTLTSRSQAVVPSVQQYGPTKSNDTVWGIAKKLNTNSSTAEHQRMMLALYDNNPKAFYKKNMNALKKGAILQTPSQQQIESRTLAQAKSEYIEQNSLWSSSSSNKVITKSSKPKEQVSTASKEQKRAEPSSNEGKLTLLTASKESSVAVTVEGNSTDTPVGSNNPEVQANMALEMATTLEAENNDVKERLNDLEAQVEKLHRLVALKNKQLAQLQSTKTVETVTKPPAPAQVKSTPEKEQPIIDTSNENLPLYAGGGLLVALLGLVLARRKKQGQKKSNTAAFETNDDIELTSSPTLTDEGISENNTTIIEEEPLLSEFTQSEFNESTQTQEADPVTECDVYIAYGRYQQAQDLIESALKTDPNNRSYKLKLLDVHFASGDASAFELLAEELADMKQSDIDGWNNIADMGTELCPNSSLFNSAKDTSDTQETNELEFYAQQQEDNEQFNEAGEQSNEIEFTAVPADDELDITSTSASTDENEPSDSSNEIEFTAVEEDKDSDIELTSSADKSDDNNEFEFDFDLIKNEQSPRVEEQTSTENEVDFESVFADENNEDTKLSLAQAYIEMEDHASARESLEDVLKSGNEEQKQRAQEMLDKL